MIKMVKDNVVMAVRDKNQAAAFCNNGWKIADEKQTDDFSQYMNPPEEAEEVKFTKTDINRMNKSELLERAKATGVEGAEEMTGAELKEYLLNVFGL
jgi:hypothetical protein